ncbi:unnamed protein product [Moneuplotes crassus]|uniref:Uncharacterized protein n=1 Tax=Euplotes crassus TaxID=5936 RepID=A0AAD2D7P0_EUPCR|nr:unnamed protein product [Moneuplotes crassus]
MSEINRRRFIRKNREEQSIKDKSPRSSSVPGSMIATPNISKLSQKDRENICEIVLQNGIDPRSLAFEIVTKRVCSVLLAQKSSEESFKSDRAFLENVVKETLEKDTSLKTTLNNIFKSSTSPCEVDIQNLTAEILSQQLSKAKSTERSQSQNRYCLSRSVIEPQFTKLTEKVSYQKSQNEGQETSDEKALEQTRCIQNSELISGVSLNIKEKELTKSDSAQEIPLDPPPKPISPSKIYYELNKDATIDRKESSSAALTRETSEEEKSQVTPKSNNLISSLPASPNQYENNYTDDMSSFQMISSRETHEITPSNTVTPKREPSSKSCIEVDILHKEYDLGRDLLQKAGLKITSQAFRQLASQTMNEYDYKILQIIFSLLLSIRDKSDVTINSLGEIKHLLSNPDEVILLLNNLATLISEKSFSGKSTSQLRDEFVKASPYVSDNQIIGSIKEYLCESFCLIDIIEEIKDFEKKHNMKKVPKTADKPKKTRRRKDQRKEQMEKSQNRTLSHKVDTIGSRFNKNVSKQRVETYHRASSKRNLSKTPKNKKMGRNQSRLMDKSTPRLTKNEKIQKKNIIKRNITNGCSFISKSPKPLGKSPTLKNISKSPKPLRVGKDYSFKQEKKATKRPTRGVQYDANGHRIMSSKNQKQYRPKNSFKKEMTPVKVGNRTVEQRDDTLLPTNLKQSPQKRKITKKSTIRKKADLHEPRVRDQNRSFIQPVNKSPIRKAISPIRSPKRKSPRKEIGRISPTKRMIQMKNSYIKNQQKAQEDPKNAGKLIYTISPNEGYIVDQEFKELTEEELNDIGKSLAEKSAELCKAADQERSEKYGDLMVKNHLKKRVQ